MFVNRSVVRQRLCRFAGTIVLGLVHSMVDAAPNNTVWDPPPSLIAVIEEHIAMPVHASPLKSYVRYYSGVTTNNRRMVIGKFLLDTVHAGIKISEINGVPRVLDGGCSVVNLKYDVRKKKIVAIFCNGVA